MKSIDYIYIYINIYIYISITNFYGEIYSIDISMDKHL